jgi:hypothetical protein
MARPTHRAWVLALAALLPVAACTTDRDDDELPETNDSRAPDYEVTIPEIDVDVDMDTATIRVPDIDVDVEGDVDKDNRED